MAKSNKKIPTLWITGYIATYSTAKEEGYPFFFDGDWYSEVRSTFSERPYWIPKKLAYGAKVRNKRGKRFVVHGIACASVACHLRVSLTHMSEFAGIFEEAYRGLIKQQYTQAGERPLTFEEAAEWIPITRLRRLGLRPEWSDAEKAAWILEMREGGFL